MSGQMKAVGEAYDGLIGAMAKIIELKEQLAIVASGAEVQLPKGVNSREVFAKKLRDRIVDEYDDQLEYACVLIGKPFLGEQDYIEELPLQVIAAIDAVAELVLSRPLTPQSYFGYRLVWVDEPEAEQTEVTGPDSQNAITLPTFEEELAALLKRHNVTRGLLNVNDSKITRCTLRVS